MSDYRVLAAKAKLAGDDHIGSEIRRIEVHETPGKPRGEYHVIQALSSKVDNMLSAQVKCPIRK